MGRSGINSRWIALIIKLESVRKKTFPVPT